MNQSQFETIVAEAIDSLPDWVHESLDDDSKMIADFSGEDAFGFRDIRGLWADRYFLYVADSMNRRIQVLSINRHADQK